MSCNKRFFHKPVQWLIAITLFLVIYDVSVFKDVKNKAKNLRPLDKTGVNVYEYIFDAYSKADLNLTSTEREEAVQYLDKSGLKGGNTRKNLGLRAKIPPEMKNKLTESHQTIMKSIPTLSMVLPYKSNSHGIVLVGGGRFSWLSFLAIKSIRKTGCTLPVELLLPTMEEYEQETELCSKTLPSLNASCVVLPDVLGPKVARHWEERIGGYQLKAMAILVSSFQHVLLLDAGNIVIQNPEEIFNDPTYTDNGMISWPDYWARAVSPTFYDIAGLTVSDTSRPRFNRFPLSWKQDDTSYSVDNDPDVPFHDLEGAIPDISTESGQLFIDKGSHSCTLLLSVYYNLLGPSLYYKLFSLGDLGEGDKDTFAAAAVVCNEKLYQVASYISTLGYFDDSGFRGVGMGQKNPIVDYAAVQQMIVDPIEEMGLNVKQQMDYIDERKAEYFDKPSSALFTIHANFPKLDPVQLMDIHNLYSEEEERLKYKMYNGHKYKHAVIKDMTIDLELDQWRTIHEALCQQNITFNYFKDKNMSKVCKLSSNQVTWLSE